MFTQIIIEIGVCFMILFDALSCGWVLLGFGNFFERMRINIISEWVGLGGDIGLYCLRMMLWSVIVSEIDLFCIEHFLLLLFCFQIQIFNLLNFLKNYFLSWYLRNSHCLIKRTSKQCLAILALRKAFL